MANSAGKYNINKEEFCQMMEDAFKSGRLINLDGLDILADENGNIVFHQDCVTGSYIGTSAGSDKSNKRSYVNVPLPSNRKFMCPDYWAKIACDYILRGTGDFIIWRDGIHTWGEIPKGHPSWRPKEKMFGPYVIDTVINHINGNSLDPRSKNLEVVSNALNTAHARLMSEIHYWYPDIVEEVEDCQGNKMHIYSDGVGISCSKIEDWNKKHKDLEIRAFKDKKGEFRSRFTLQQMNDMLDFFGVEH